MQGRSKQAGARRRNTAIGAGLALVAALPCPLWAGQPVIRAIGASQGVESRVPGEVIRVPRHTVLIRSVNAQADTVMAVTRPSAPPVAQPVPPQPTPRVSQQAETPLPAVASAAPASARRAPPPLPPPLPTDPAQMRARMDEALAELRAGGDRQSPAQQALAAVTAPAQRGLVGVRRILPPQRQAPAQTGWRVPLKARHLRAYQTQVADASFRYGVEEALVRAVIHAESAYNPMAVSRAGAAGLMQLMPGTARTYGVSNRFDPTQNIEGGTRYLSMLLRRYHGDVRLAAAAYNAGEGAVDRYGGIPPYKETKAYVQRVTNLLSSYRAALGGWVAGAPLLGVGTARQLAYSPTLRAISGN